MNNAMLKAIEDNAERLTPEQQKRLEIVKETDASNALEGIKPLHIKGGYPYELQQKWVMGEITSNKEVYLLKKHYGID